MCKASMQLYPMFQWELIFQWAWWPFSPAAERGACPQFIWAEAVEKGLSGLGVLLNNCKNVVSRSTVLENDFEWYQLLISVIAGGGGALRGMSLERKQ